MTVSASQQRGFTLVECLMALAIVAILASLATPGYHSLRLRAQQHTVIFQLEAAVMQARHLALLEATTVLLCPRPQWALTGSNAPHEQALCGERYLTGAAVWLKKDAGWVLHRVWQWPAQQVTNRKGDRAAGERVVFSRLGLSNRPVTWSTCVGATNLSLVLNRVGRPIRRRQWGRC